VSYNEAKRITEKYIFPTMEKLPCPTITKKHILEWLKPLYYTKHETAKKARGYAQQIIDHAGVKLVDNPATWEALKRDLHKSSDIYESKPFAALPYEQIPEFFKTLRTVQPDKQVGRISAKATEFYILTVGRTHMTRFLKWKEINWGKKLWVCPAIRDDGTQGHKTGKRSKKPYIVPLSNRAMEILQEMKAMQVEEGINIGPDGCVSRDGYVFVHGWPLQEWQRNKAIRRQLGLEDKQLGQAWASSFLNQHMDGKKLINMEGEEGITQHGFRTTFQMWAIEVEGAADIVSEMALGHEVGGNQFGKYAGRTAYLHLRSRMQLHEAWAAYCLGETPPSVVVTPPAEVAKTPARPKLRLVS